MIIDIHSHILPEIDDGSESVEMSLKMLEIMKAQGVDKVVATPHFYAHKEKSVEHFLERRQKSYEKLIAANPPLKNIVLGAEVAVEKDLSEKSNVGKLAIEGTDLILFELQYAPFADWMLEEIDCISVEYKLSPIIAHIHRYLPYYSSSDFDKVLQSDAILQVNNEAFGEFKQRSFVKKLMKNDFQLLFGSDCHKSCNVRVPNWDLLKKKLKAEEINRSMELFSSHLN